MPNKITYTVRTANTTKSIEYWNPYTKAYQDANPLTGIPAGSYSDLKARLKGSNPSIIATYAGVVTVVNAPANSTGKFLIVADGDSRTAEGTAENPWPTQLRAALPSTTYTVAGKAVGGSTSQELRDRVTQTVDPLYSATNYDLCVYCLFTGVNDFHLSSNRDTASTKANLEAVVRGRVAIGFKVLVYTSTKIKDRDYSPQIKEVNDYIRANAISWGASAIVDLDKETLLQNPYDNNVWLADGLHLMPYANTAIARASKRKIDEVLIANGFTTSTVVWNIDSVYEGGLYTATPLLETGWKDLTNATATGSTLRLTRGGTAHSTLIGGVSGEPVRLRVQFNVTRIQDCSIWLNDSSKVSDISNFDDSVFALFFQSNGQVRPFGRSPESTVGIYQASVSYNAGDVFDWQIERGQTGSSNGQYTWFKNGVKIGTWLSPVPSGNLEIDTSAENDSVFANVKVAGPNVISLTTPTPTPTTPTPTPATQDDKASLYVEQQGEDVSWRNLSYATANGNSLSYNYVIAHANSTRAIGASSAALRGFYEFTILHQGGNAHLGLDIKDSIDNEPTTPLYSLLSIENVLHVRLSNNPNAIFEVTSGSVVRVQIGRGGYSLFVNKELKDSLVETIEQGNLRMALGGTGAGSFDNVKIWGANLITL